MTSAIAALSDLFRKALDHMLQSLATPAPERLPIPVRADDPRRPRGVLQRARNNRYGS